MRYPLAMPTAEMEDAPASTSMLESALDTLGDWVPTLITIVFCLAALRLLRLFLQRYNANGTKQGAAPVFSQLFYFLCMVAALIAVILSTPLPAGEHGDLLSVLGLLLTGSIALSSTTFLGNAMAGMMLRSVNHFKPGDFLRVDDHFGRVSEHGLLHTEIQTADREFTTLPNLYLVTHPVTVVDKTGTVVSAKVSLGYDVHHEKAQATLIEAAEQAGLNDSFVQILELGDYSIQYRLAGFLPNVKYLISARSKLRAAMLDALHSAHIEIISPTFANERLISDDIIVANQIGPRKMKEESKRPEDLMFDKAERAHSLEKLRDRLTEVTSMRQKLSDDIAGAKDAAKERLLLHEQLLANEIERLTVLIQDAEKEQS